MEETKKMITKEKYKITTEVIKENPVDKKSTGTKIIQNKNSIILQKL